jgi:PAS domain S-box-containing protein
VLTSSLDIEATLTTLTQLAVPAIADWCVVDLVDREGALNRLAITHRDPRLAPVAEELRLRYPNLTPDQSHTLWTVLQQQRPFLDPAVDQQRFVAQARDDRHVELLSQLGFVAELVVPLIARGRVLGAITLVLADRDRSFSADDVALAQEVGRTAALAIDNARLYADARSAEAYYRSLLKGTVDGVIVTDEDGQYLEINPAAERMLGYEIDELQALQEAGDGSLVEDPSVRSEVWSVLRETGQWSGQWTIRRKDGSLLPIDVSATRVALPDQTVYIAIWRDASQRVRLERLQRDFFAMVTHDLRTPLTVIRSGAQLLQMREAYRASTVAGILSASDRMVRLINDLADLVSLEDGHIALHRETVRLGELVREVVAGLPDADRSRVVVEPMDRAVEGHWDPVRLGQVVQNLIDNALSHAPGSTLRVRVENAGSEARVTVSDDGPGIDPEHVPLLFERFYRASATGAGGLGLGLYICRMLIEAHGGRISVQSSPGHGSTFWFSLPRAG